MAKKKTTENKEQTKTKAKKARIIFDKKLLCFKVKRARGWNYQVTHQVLKKQSKIVRRNLLQRTVQICLSEEPKTFADLLKVRIDWLKCDEEGQYGTDEAIRLTLENCKNELNKMDDQLDELGFKRVGLASKLKEEDRKSNTQASLFERLSSIPGLELK